MPMKPGDAEELTKLYLPEWKKNRDRLDKVYRWYRNKLNADEKPVLPSKATNEYRGLRDRSLSPWLRLAVTVVAQSLFVDGYRGTEGGDNLAPWAIWQRNGFDRRQLAIHRGALSLSIAYATALPGDPVPKLRGVSARSMLALYQDPSEDEWPMYALSAKSAKGADGRSFWRFRLWDDEAVYLLDVDESLDRPRFITHEVHDSGVCPVVRYTNDIDLDGEVDGEVEPYIDLAARINQDTFDRLVTQRFQAWAVRYATGLVEPETDEEKKAQVLRLSQEDILVSEGTETKFGVLPPTPLDGLLKAKEADIHEFAALTQTPPQDLIGQMINLSAEALAAANDGKTRKVRERHHSFGESHEQLLRLAAHQAGDTEAAGDFSAQIVWADPEPRSLAQVADAFGKLVQQLGVPAEGLWERIPGVTSTDAEAWKKMAAENDAVSQMLAQIGSGLTSPPDGLLGPDGNPIAPPL